MSGTTAETKTSRGRMLRVFCTIFAGTVVDEPVSHTRHRHNIDGLQLAGETWSKMTGRAGRDVAGGWGGVGGRLTGVRNMEIRTAMWMGEWRGHVCVWEEGSKSTERKAV